MKLSLSISRFSWLSTLNRWAAELRSKAFLDEDDFVWIPWTPEITSSMTITNTIVHGAFYARKGGMVWFACHVGFDTGGVASPIVNISCPPVPVVPSIQGGSMFSAAIELFDGAAIAGTGIFGDSGLISVRRFDGANWALAGGRDIRCSGFYRTNL